MCNWVHLRIVFALLYSVSVLSCVDVVWSFTYALWVIWTSLKDVGDSTRKSEMQFQRPLTCTIQKKRRNKIRNFWLWLVCCCLLPTCYFHWPFSHAYMYTCTHTHTVSIYMAASWLGTRGIVTIEDCSNATYLLIWYNMIRYSDEIYLG